MLGANAVIVAPSPKGAKPIREGEAAADYLSGLATDQQQCGRPQGVGGAR